MLTREPLTDRQNECFTRRKVQRTYGKSAKASAAMASAKEIFTATNELEKTLQHLTINDEKENTGQPHHQEVVERSEEVNVMSKKVRAKKPHSQQPGRLQNIETPTTTSTATKPSSTSRIKRPNARTASDSSSNTAESQPSPPQLPEDDLAIHRFASKYSDRTILPFESYGTTIAKLCNVKKIGEGTYSSVFALTRKDSIPTPRNTPSQNSESTSTQPDDPLQRTTILKMMPIAPPSTPDLPDQTTPQHIANELETMQLMDSIHGFIRYRSLTIVRGAWPANFLAAFRQFKTACHKKAENEDPETAYGDAQYYALIEMEDAGAELSDAIKRPSDFQMYDVFWQTAMYLASAEDERAFEHRDLHVSNICVRPDVISGEDDDEERIDVTEELVSRMTRAPEMVLGLSNIAVTLIDYTYSRLTLPPDGEYSEDGTKRTNFREFVVEGDDYDRLLAKTLSAKEQKRIGNSGEKFEDRMQQLTYAKVAKMVDAVHEQAEREGTVYDSAVRRYVAPWERSVPRTNVCWLGYLLTCLLGRAGKTSKTKYVAGSNEVAKQVQDDLRRRMIQLKEVLLEEDFERMPSSAADVVRIGVERAWLTRDEIEKFKERLEMDS